LIIVIILIHSPNKSKLKGEERGSLRGFPPHENLLNTTFQVPTERNGAGAPFVDGGSRRRGRTESSDKLFEKKFLAFV
jgi:hypothetical protein